MALPSTSRWPAALPSTRLPGLALEKELGTSERVLRRRWLPTGWTWTSGSPSRGSVGGRGSTARRGPWPSSWALFPLLWVPLGHPVFLHRHQHLRILRLLRHRHQHLSRRRRGAAHRVLGRSSSWLLWVFSNLSSPPPLPMQLCFFGSVVSGRLILFKRGRRWLWVIMLVAWISVADLPAWDSVEWNYPCAPTPSPPAFDFSLVLRAGCASNRLKAFFIHWYYLTI